MKITQEEVVNRQTILNIEVEDDDLSPYLDHGYKKIVRRASIPGFRKGKAPRRIVEQLFGQESLINESLDLLLPDVTSNAIKEQGLETVGIPSVELVGFDPVAIKATVPLTPEINLGAYKEIRVTKGDISTTNKEIDDQIEEIRKSQSAWEPVDRPVKQMDMVTIDVSGHIGKDIILNEKDAVFLAELESPNPFPGFSEQLEGIEPEGSKNFEIQVADDHPDKRFAAKQIDFNVVVKEIKEQRLPPLNDEFAKGLDDKYDSLEDLKASVKEDLVKMASAKNETEYKNLVLQELLNTVDIVLPPILIEQEVERMVERRDTMIGNLKMDKEDYFRYIEKTEEQLLEEAKESTVEHFTRFFALAELAKKEDLNVPEHEIDKRIEEIEKSDSEEAQDLKRRGLDSERVRSSIKGTILNEKAIDSLVVIATGKSSDDKELKPDTNHPNEDNSQEQDGG